MKIGILTFHRAINYGAILQCFAMQEVLGRLGCDVEVIDYRNPYMESERKLPHGVKPFLKNIIKLDLRSYLHKNRIRKLKLQAFDSFRDEYIKVSSQRYLSTVAQGFDKVIIGSDQMWSFGCYKTYDPVFWGDFPREKNCGLYGYAISSNADFVKPLSLSVIRANVNRFDNISFREAKIQELIKCLTGRDCPLSLDPTLLTEESVWKPMFKDEWSKKKFVVVYQVREPNKKKVGQIYQQAHNYAKEIGCEVIDLNKGAYIVEDFISCIKYAKCVFTSSFHATAFSLIFNTPFFSFALHDGGDLRYEQLLKSLDLEEHLVECDAHLQVPLKIDENVLRKGLKMMQQNSISYLKQIVSE